MPMNEPNMRVSGEDQQQRIADVTLRDFARHRAEDVVGPDDEMPGAAGEIEPAEHQEEHSVTASPMNKIVPTPRPHR